MPVSSQAQTTYYWDNNGTSAGFGTAGGTWAVPTDNQWTTDPLGLATPATGITTSTLDTLNFGYYGLGLAAGTITVGGTVDAGNLTLAPTSGSLVLSGGTINLGAAATITTLGNSQGNPTNTFTIASVIAGASTSLTQVGAGTVILNQANTYTGNTVINGGTLSNNFNLISNAGGFTLSGSGSITASSGLTLNGGGVLNLVNTTTGVDRVSDTAPITSNGGTIAFTNTSGVNLYTETVGTVSLVRGQLNLVLTNSQTGGQTLTLSGLTRTGATNTSAVTFSSGGGLNTTTNQIVVTGAVATTAGQIIGPWATTGTAANSQTDYAVYNSSSQVVPANIAASSESTWANVTDAYTANDGLGATTLTATRNIAALRSVSASSSVTVASSVITLTSNIFADGDAVIFTSAPTGTTAGLVYYVRDVSGNTFRVAATSGGPALTLTSASGSITGGITLGTGINLGTTGILHTTSSLSGIGTGTGGSVTLPSAVSDNLYVTIGAASVNTSGGFNHNFNIAAPIDDNGAGILTLVKNGPGNLRLSSTTSTFSGGLVINAGNVVWTADANLGAAGVPVTINASTALGDGGSTLTLTAANRAVILNDNVIATVARGTITLNGPVQGSGGISVFHSNAGSSIANLNSTSNTFTGPLRFQGTNVTLTITVNSLSDSVGAGNIVFGYIAGGAQTMTFNYGTGAVAPLTLNNRRIELGTGPQVQQAIGNNSSQALTINTNLLDNSTTVAKTLNLNGTGTGISTFAGNILQATSTLSIAKAGTGTWVLGGTNTYSGTTTISSGGILAATNPQAFGTNLNGININGGGTISLRNDSSVTFGFGGSPYNINGSSSPSTIIIDRITGTGTNTLTVGNLTTTSTTGTWQYNFVGANGVSLNAGTLSTPINAATSTSTINNTIAGGGSLTLNSVALGSTGTSSLIFIGTGNTTITNAMTQAGSAQSLTHNGTGTVTLVGANTYTGTTGVSSGTLLVNGTHTGGAAYTVSGTGTLGGSGSIPAAVSVTGTGTLAGGDPTSVVNNALTLTAGFTNVANARIGVRLLTNVPDLVATNPASNNFLNITGGSTTIDPGTLFVIAGTPTPALNPLGSYTYRIAAGAGDQSLLSIASPVQFDATTLTGGGAFTFTVTGNAGGDVFLNLTPVPEPMTVGLVAAAGMGLMGFARRRRASA